MKNSRVGGGAMLVLGLGLALAGPGLAWGAESQTRQPVNASAVLAEVPVGRSAPRMTEAAFDADLRPLLRRYCLECHSTAKAKGDLDLEGVAIWAEAARHPRIWQGVLEQMHLGEMPPKDQPQPTGPERDRLVQGVTDLLEDLALARAGDPGPVIIRRLSNAEYTYTLRDLTGVESLDPAREFPVDGAAGEGFMNTGQSLVMSPTLLTKYLDAAREVTAHVVLGPDGFRFSAATTRRDWTDETVGRIRELYRRYTDARGGTKVQLQGLEWETNEGGRLPLDRYFGATIAVRKALRSGSGRLSAVSAVSAVAREEGLSARYLERLWGMLQARDGSPVLEPLRARWRSAGPGDVPALVEQVGRWQKALWKFGSVGHIGKVGGPKAWMEPVSPVVDRQELRVKPGPAAVDADGALTLRLVTTDAGDGVDGDVVVWERPRFVGAGRPEILLRDVRALSADLSGRRAALVASVTQCLAAAAEVSDLGAGDGAAAGSPATDLTGLARRHGADPERLEAWLEYLGLGRTGPARLTGHFTNRLVKMGGFDFVMGWGSPETPSAVVNGSDRDVRIPGNLKARGVAVHPSPTVEAVVAWRSPVAGVMRVDATVQHAHPECGNGVAWVVEVRRGVVRERWAQGVAQGGKPVNVGPLEGVPVRVGDAVVLRVGPRDGNHACDLTAVDLELVALSEDGREPGRSWNLAKDLASDGGAANPHADAWGHGGVWHFLGEPVSGGADTGVTIPAGSVLARWRSSRNPAERADLARDLAALLRSDRAAGSLSGPDEALRRQVLALGGPLYRARLLAGGLAVGTTFGGGTGGIGLDPAGFGAGTGAGAGESGGVDGGSLRRVGPGTVEFRVPADLVEGMEFVTTATLDKVAGREGSVQVRVETGPGFGAGGEAVGGLVAGIPVVVGSGGGARERVEGAFAVVRELFPAALAYLRIVPVDEVVTLTLFHREDEALRRLMLDEAEVALLDRLWSELRFVSQDALALVDAFAQLMEYATQDADPRVFEPLREPIQARAAALRREWVEAEPRHVEALVELASRAYRRPLDPSEAAGLRGLYARLRAQELSHEEAFRLTLARVFVAPAFLYRAEKPVPGTAPGPVTDWELASRLSYFLWSSVPDEELRAAAASGRLKDPGELAAQARRMLKDARVRRLATEFGCQWLHVHGFDALDEKSERHFPTFAGVRGAMYEEVVRYFTDFFQADGTVGGLIDGDHVFVNASLAEHYGIPGVTGPEWRRLDGARVHGRGGILGLGATLAKQSGASRTSPILRGNWLSEVVLGEKLPRPPKDVPRLPEDEAATAGLTVRALVERHSLDPRCAGCHVRIDPYGFALEGYDAIGRRREKDLGDRPVATRAKTADGAEFDGLDGLRRYLLTQRRMSFERQFCRKLLGYALGREVQISDHPLIDAMRSGLAAGGDRVGPVIEAIVRSRQFREIRGRDEVKDGVVAERGDPERAAAR